DPALALIEGLRVSADNEFLGVSVNGQSVFSRKPASPEEFGSFIDVGNIGLGSFHSGLNTIDFTLVNLGFGNVDFGESPSALRVEGVVVGSPLSAPEPSSLMLAGLGLAAMAGHRLVSRSPWATRTTALE